MPRAVYAMLWKAIESGKEIFAYVQNLAKNGDHYWVLAHVTPTFGSGGEITGFHSSRRTPDRGALVKIKGIYADLLAEERKWSTKAQQVTASTALLQRVIEQRGMPYDELIFSL
jgi:hypothetical protein